MPARNLDLHGNVPDTCQVALLLIDVINDLEFSNAEKLLKPALRAAAHIVALKQRARAFDIPVIYANDNFGRWRSDFSEVVRHCLLDGVRGRGLTELLTPQREDYLVLKPKHSAFFSTTLETLLEYLKVKRLILTGIRGDSCVLVTAVDAYMRDFELFVPDDCAASFTPADNRHALEYMARALRADTRPSSRLDLGKLAGRKSRASKKRSKPARKHK